MRCVDCPDMPNGTRKRPTCCRRTGAELVSDRIRSGGVVVDITQPRPDFLKNAIEASMPSVKRAVRRAIRDAVNRAR